MESMQIDTAVVGSQGAGDGSAIKKALVTEINELVDQLVPLQEIASAQRDQVMSIEQRLRQFRAQDGRSDVEMDMSKLLQQLQVRDAQGNVSTKTESYNAARKRIKLAARDARKDLYPVIDKMKPKATRMKELGAVDNKDYKIKSKLQWSKEFLTKVRMQSDDKLKLAGYFKGAQLEAAVSLFLQRPFVFDFPEQWEQGQKFKVYNFSRVKYSKKKKFSLDVGLQFVPTEQLISQWGSYLGYAVPNATFQQRVTDLPNAIAAKVASYEAALKAGDPNTRAQTVSDIAREYIRTAVTNLTENNRTTSNRMMTLIASQLFQFNFLIGSPSGQFTVAQDNMTNATLLDAVFVSRAYSPLAACYPVAQLLVQSGYSRSFIHWASRGYNCDVAKVSFTVTNPSLHSLIVCLFNSQSSQSARDCYYIPPTCSITLTSQQFQLTDYVMLTGYSQNVTFNIVNSSQSTFGIMGGQNNSLVPTKVPVDTGILFSSDLSAVRFTFTCATLYVMDPRDRVARYDPTDYTKKDRIQWASKIEAVRIPFMIRGHDARMILTKDDKYATALESGAGFLYGSDSLVPVLPPDEDSSMSTEVKSIKKGFDKYALLNTDQQRWLWIRTFKDFRQLYVYPQLLKIIYDAGRSSFDKYNGFSPGFLDLAQRNNVPQQALQAFANTIGIPLPFDEQDIRDGGVLGKRQRTSLYL